VLVQGEVVALARMQPAPLVRDGGEARFLHDQYRVIAAGSLGLIVVALLTAALLARRWTRPLAAVQDATQRLARGELTVRLPAGPDLADRSDEIGDVVRNVNRMAEGLQRLEGARRRWLADISHELRTPLTVLRGDIEALQDGVRPLRLEAVGVLHDEVLRIGKLVDDLHLLATSDLQALPCHFAPADALDLLQRVGRRFKGRARAAGLSVSLQGLDGLAPLLVLPVNWDADRVEQLLANLMENSLRYTDAPGQIRIGLRQADDTVKLVVEDSAHGVPADQWPQLFEPLYRGDAARARLHGGSGLGLAICEAIARAHGGQLGASASALGGLCITVTLPQHPQAQEPQQAAAEARA
jgi:two-component system sensor histidine kinase BaeS